MVRLQDSTHIALKMRIPSQSPPERRPWPRRTLLPSAASQATSDYRPLRRTLLDNSPSAPILKREGSIIHVNNERQPIIPFFVVVILLIFAVLAASFATICCWRSRKSKAKAASEADANRDSLFASRPGPGGGGLRQEVPTLVFQQHEPDTHGYFAPLYLDPQASRGHDGQVVIEEDAKRELRRIWNPGMLEEERIDERKDEEGGSPVTDDEADLKDKPSIGDDKSKGWKYWLRRVRG